MDQNKARDMPKPVPFIIFYALCERYSSMGVAGTIFKALFISLVKQILHFCSSYSCNFSQHKTWPQ